MNLHRIVTIALTLALAAALLTTPAAAAPLAAPPGVDAQWCGQSAYPSAHAGDTVALSVCFMNVGTTSWIQGAGTEVALSVCVDMPAPQYWRCNLLSPFADWAVNWTSTRIYALAPKNVVGPSDFTFFSYSLKVPAGTSPGDYYFRGELIHRATLTPIHPVGYYHIVTVIP